VDASVHDVIFGWMLMSVGSQSMEVESEREEALVDADTEERWEGGPVGRKSRAGNPPKKEPRSTRRWVTNVLEPVVLTGLHYI